MALTVKGIARLKHGRYRDRETRGLYLQVGPTGTKSWLLRFEIGGRERFMGLGEFPTFSLKEARERARAQRQLLADGIDPIDKRNADRRASEQQARKDASVPTFREAAQRYVAVHGPKWTSAKHGQQVLSRLKTHAFPKLGALRVDQITTDDVLASLEPIWNRIPETASRVRGRIENVLSWAIANRYREGPNPARWSDNLEHLLAGRSQNGNTNHFAAMPFAEVPSFLIELRQRQGTASRALEFLILTAGRTGEVLGATWDEIDIKERTWTIPAARMKVSKEHRVPLADAALAILQSLPREKGNTHIFIGPRAGTGLSSVALLRVLSRLGRGDVTTHGFRSSFKDWTAERTSFPNIVSEAALAHTIPSAVEAAYRRGDLFDKRRKLMDSWARFITSTPTTASGEVVAIRKRGA